MEIKTLKANGKEIRVPQDIPPCMVELMGKLEDGLLITRADRFILISYLNFHGVEKEEIKNLFSSTPGFKKGVLKYQINHLTGEIDGWEYLPPQCYILKDAGVCPIDCQCEGITNPVEWPNDVI